jgi:hypothetical protein
MDLFRVLTDSSELMRSLKRRLAADTRVVPGSVVLTSEFKRHASGLVFELYVDCDTRAGMGAAWCADLKAGDQQLVLSRDVRINDASGQRVVRQFPQLDIDLTSASLVLLVKSVEELTLVELPTSYDDWT